MNRILIKSRDVLPPGVLLVLKGCYCWFRSLFYVGRAVTCPCCGRRFRRLMAVRRSRRCPRCLSFERQRLIQLYLENKTEFFTANLKVLHVAPAYCFQRSFTGAPNLEYISADISSPYAIVKMDITDIGFEDSSFDVILCSHVLEHVVDDRKAMRELFRVLRPGGWAILQAPIEREVTFEDPNVVSPEERERVFGQHDHVRSYGLDYLERLEEAGFNVNVDEYARELGAEAVKRYVLWDDDVVFYCTRDAGNASP